MSEHPRAETEARTWAHGLAFGSPSSLEAVEFNIERRRLRLERCHDRTFAEPPGVSAMAACIVHPPEVTVAEAAASAVPPVPCPLGGEPPPVPDITAEDARARVKEFAGVEPVIIATAKWMPGQDVPHVTWTVRVYSPHPASIETGGLTLTGAIEQLRAAVADSAGWRKQS